MLAVAMEEAGGRGMIQQQQQHQDGMSVHEYHALAQERVESVLSLMEDVRRAQRTLGVPLDVLALVQDGFVEALRRPGSATARVFFSTV
jgi:hypothetical protein